jgi:hypothetical protein
MAQHGAYARRNKAHKDRYARLLAQAGNDWDRLRVNFDSFRASVRLLQRRRPPLGTPAGTHDAAAAELVREAADYLQRLVLRIDAGEFDAQREVA